MEIKQEKHNYKMITHTKTFSSPLSLLHWHYNCEICQVIDNPMRFLINGTLVEAKPGDIIVIGENVVHQFQLAYGPTKVCIMQFSLKVLVNAGIPIKRCKVHITAEELARIPGLTDRLSQLFALIEAEKSTVHGENNYYQQCLVSALYCLLVRYFAEEGSANLSKEQKEFLQILEYISEHFEDNINVNILAERLFMYRGTISALFSKYSGMSLNEYVYSLRIKKANELMNQGSSIIDAALESGFQSVRTFNNIYKKITGITPTEYKNRGHLQE